MTSRALCHGRFIPKTLCLRILNVQLLRLLHAFAFDFENRILALVLPISYHCLHFKSFIQYCVSILYWGLLNLGVYNWLLHGF